MTNETRWRPLRHAALALALGLALAACDRAPEQPPAPPPAPPGPGSDLGAQQSTSFAEAAARHTAA
jgi:hypothetical protein